MVPDGLVPLQVLEAFDRAEKKLKPDWRLMFTDVYEKMPKILHQQLKEMEEHVERHQEHYPTANYAKAKESIE